MDNKNINDGDASVCEPIHHISFDSTWKYIDFKSSLNHKFYNLIIRSPWKKEFHTFIHVVCEQVLTFCCLRSMLWIICVNTRILDFSGKTLKAHLLLAERFDLYMCGIFHINWIISSKKIAYMGMHQFFLINSKGVKLWLLIFLSPTTTVFCLFQLESLTLIYL